MIGTVFLTAEAADTLEIIKTYASTAKVNCGRRAHLGAYPATFAEFVIDVDHKLLFGVFLLEGFSA